MTKMNRKKNKDFNKIMNVIKKNYPKIPIGRLNDIEKNVRKRLMGIQRKGCISILDQNAQEGARRLIVAYIRHNMTNYDDLLNFKNKSREQARKETNRLVYNIMAEWQGLHSRNISSFENTSKNDA